MRKTDARPPESAESAVKTRTVFTLEAASSQAVGSARKASAASSKGLASQASAAHSRRVWAAPLKTQASAPQRPAAPPARCAMR